MNRWGVSPSLSSRSPLSRHLLAVDGTDDEADTSAEDRMEDGLGTLKLEPMALALSAKELQVVWGRGRGRGKGRGRGRGRGRKGLQRKSQVVSCGMVWV